MYVQRKVWLYTQSGQDSPIHWYQRNARREATNLKGKLNNRIAINRIVEGVGEVAAAVVDEDVLS